MVTSLDIVETAVAAYSLILLTRVLFTDDFRLHAQLIWHIFVLSAFSLLHLYFVTFGPDLDRSSTLASPVADREHLISLFLSLSVLLSTGTIRLGPDAFRERSRLYDRAVTSKVKEVGESIDANVFGCGDSIIGSYMSLSTTKLMQQISAGEQIDLHELPVLPADLQTEPTTIALKPRILHGQSRMGPIMSLVWTVSRPIWVAQVKGECARDVYLVSVVGR